MNFLAVSKKFSTLDDSRAVILKAPYEFTTSYGKGCEFGPNAIINASSEVELYDEEVDDQIHKIGIHTTEIKGFSTDHNENLQLIGKRYTEFFTKKKFTVALGGEHSISIGIVNALADGTKDFGVIQFDAHADLRNYFGKSNTSHGCVHRRIRERVSQTSLVGIRSLSKSEAQFIKKSGQQVLWAKNMMSMDTSAVLQEISQNITKKDVYITFDVDYFGQDVIRSTGTPEPGGVGWYKTLEILRELFLKYNVIGMDFVELIGDHDDYASAFSVALLVKKCIAYKFFA